MTGEPPRLPFAPDEAEGLLSVSGAENRLSVPVAAAMIGAGSLVTWAVIWTALHLLFG